MSGRNNSNSLVQRPGRRRRGASDTSDSEESQARRMRNRASAKRFRDKKLQATEDLQKKNEELEKKNKELAMEKTKLEKSLRQYASLIRSHLRSGCHLPEDVLEILNSECDEPDDLQLGNGSVDELESEDMCEDVSLQNSGEGFGAKPTGMFSGANLEKEVGDSVMNNKTKSSLTKKTQHVDNFHQPYNNVQMRLASGKVVQSTSPPSQLVPNIDARFDANKHEGRTPIVVPKMTLPRSFLDASLTERGSQGSGIVVAETMIAKPALTDVNRQGAREFKATQFMPSASQAAVTSSSNNVFQQIRYSANLNPSPASPQQVQDANIAPDLLAQALIHVNPNEMSTSFQEQIKQCKSQSENMNTEKDETLDQSQMQNNELATNLQMAQFPQYYPSTNISVPIVPNNQTYLESPQPLDKDSQARTCAQARALTQILCSSTDTTANPFTTDSFVQNNDVPSLQVEWTTDVFGQNSQPQMMVGLPWIDQVVESDLVLNPQNAQIQVISNPTDEATVQMSEQQYVPSSQIPTTVFSEAENLEAEQNSVGSAVMAYNSVYPL